MGRVKEGLEQGLFLHGQEAQGTCHLTPHLTGKQAEAEGSGACLRAWAVSEGRAESEMQIPGQDWPFAHSWI